MVDPPYQMFWDVLHQGLPKPGDSETLRVLKQAASLWRDEGKYFSAAYAMERAVHCAWGDPDEMKWCLNASMENYQRCVETNNPCSHEGFAALKKMAQLCWGPYLGPGDEATLRRFSDELLRELAERLVACYSTSNEAESYLVRGVVVEADLAEGFRASYPDYEVDWQTESWDRTHIRINLPSAFRLFIYEADYYGAQAVIDRYPEAFTTPSLRGWKAAVRGFLRPQEAAESFEEAANAFAEDRCPTELPPGRSWSSINVDLWSPYFLARSAISSALQEPGRAKEFIATAAKVLPRDRITWSHPEVIRFAILVGYLNQLLSTTSTADLREFREEFLRDVRWTGERPGDDLADRFLILATEAFEGFHANPATELTKGRLRDALNALKRIPLFTPGFADAVEPALGNQALHLVYGPVRTWIHRTLEGIGDERQLHKIILRLAQASLPAYAQILHGPLEYGKDVVVLLEEQGSRVLRMYQVKAGDITTPVWRTARQELEEAFLVPLPGFLITGEPHPVRVGVLICNGHAATHVLPSMEGWFQEQKRDHGREIQFMHVDDIVQWIEKDRLVNELKAVLAELGIAVVPY